MLSYTQLAQRVADLERGQALGLGEGDAAEIEKLNGAINELEEQIAAQPDPDEPLDALRELRKTLEPVLGAEGGDDPPEIDAVRAALRELDDVMERFRG